MAELSDRSNFAVNSKHVSVVPVFLSKNVKLTCETRWFGALLNLFKITSAVAGICLNVLANW